jgi:5-methylcytosine-specific restriction endonuclease McrA
VCGLSVSSAISFAVAHAENNGVEPAPFDEELYSRYAKTIAERNDERYAVRDREWKEWYDSYLQTEEWKKKSLLVLKRERFICQGCRERRAVLAHHLTYKHVGHELLFELAALCLGCHARVHSINAPGDPKMSR